MNVTYHVGLVTYHVGGHVTFHVGGHVSYHVGLQFHEHVRWSSLFEGNCSVAFCC